MRSWNETAIYLSTISSNMIKHMVLGDMQQIIWSDHSGGFTVANEYLCHTNDHWYVRLL